MKVTYQFRCKVCGHHSPVDELAGRHKGFAIFKRSLGGKEARSESEKLLLKVSGAVTGRGSAHGRIGYTELDNFTRSLYLDQYIQQLEDALVEAKKMKQEATK